MNILLTAIGGPSGMCFAKSLREIEGIRLVGTNAEEDALGKPFVDSFRIVPLGTDPQYLSAIKQIIVDEKIDYVMPFVDEELYILSKHADELGTNVFVSPFKTVSYTGDKIKAYDIANEFLPTQFKKEEVASFPIFAKPRIGRGGKGTAIITEPKQLEQLPEETYVFQELLRGPEVSVDTFFDFDGSLLVAVPRIRASVVHGISVKGIVFRHNTLIQIITELAKKMTFVGPINFQFMLGKDGYKLTEINARGSGGMGITISAGVDMPKLSYEMMKHRTLSAIPAMHVGTYRNFNEVTDRQRILSEKRAQDA